jgi:hypothetical protein
MRGLDDMVRTGTRHVGMSEFRTAAGECDASRAPHRRCRSFRSWIGGGAAAGPRSAMPAGALVGRVRVDSVGRPRQALNRLLEGVEILGVGGDPP